MEATTTTGPERFEDWSEACDAAVERDRPISAIVDTEEPGAVWTVFPSRQVRRDK